MPAKKKASIIGAGLGGMATAIRLAHHGFSVTVFEQQPLPGGKAAELKNDGFRFDTGPSLLTMPEQIKKIFDLTGRKIEDYLDIQAAGLSCKYFYNDGTVINAYGDKSKFINELTSKTKTTELEIQSYFDYCKTINDLSSELFLENSLSEISTFTNFKAFKSLLNINKLDTMRSMHKANSSFFNDEKVIQLFDRYATYNGSNPYSAPATLNIIPHVEHSMGTYYVKNGIYSISNALYKLAVELGVNFKFNTLVESIKTESDSVKEIIFKTHNKADTKKFDVIVSNADVGFTYSKLLNNSEHREARRYNKLEPSSSALVYYWGINSTFNNLEAHNILFSNSYENEFREIFVEKTSPTDPTIYIYISSKFNENDAPENMENWFVMINVPYNSGQDWDAIRIKSRERIISKINGFLNTDLEKHIISENFLDPTTIEKSTNSKFGSLYGISSNSKFAAFLRQQNKSKKYKHLYFVGGSAHPGGGIPLVLLSAQITVDLIRKYE